MDNPKFKHIEAESLTLKHPDGKASIAISAMRNGAGIWVNQDGTDGSIIAIYTLDHQTCVGLYGKGNKTAINIGLWVDEDGNPGLQLKGKDGSVIELNHEQLAKLA